MSDVDKKFKGKSSMERRQDKAHKALEKSALDDVKDIDLNDPEIQDAFLKKLARKDLMAFSVLSDKNYKINWHHQVIANKLQQALQNTIQKKPTRIILELPPRSGKSQLASINFPAWAIGRYPGLNFIVASYSLDLATDFGSATRDLLNSPNYQRIFNTRLRTDTKAKTHWQVKAGGTYTASGVGGGITGRGFNIGVIDDPLKNREQADSELHRDKIWKWYKDVFYTRQDGNAAIICIMTRWSQDDLVGRLLDEQERLREEGEEFCEWEVLRFPAIAQKGEEYRKKGEALWPDRFSLQELSEKRATLGPYSWGSLYQQSPIPETDQTFQSKWFRYADKDELKVKDYNVYVTVDTAIGETESACYTGIVQNYVDRENNWYIEAERARMNPSELIDRLFQLYQKHGDNLVMVGMEKTTLESAIRVNLDEKMEKRGIYFQVKDLSHKNSQKVVRIKGLIPRYNDGKIYHLRGLTSKLEEELLNFPHGKTDDIIDALQYQLQIAEPPYGTSGSRTQQYIPDYSKLNLS